jgi:integrase
VNVWLRVINTYLKWSQASFRLPKLQQPKRVIATFSRAQIDGWIHFKVRTRAEMRTHTMACLFLNTGIRVGEASRITRGDVDWDRSQIFING